jgi:hypothetical protein
VAALGHKTGFRLKRKVVGRQTGRAKAKAKAKAKANGSLMWSERYSRYGRLRDDYVTGYSRPRPAVRHGLAVFLLARRSMGVSRVALFGAYWTSTTSWMPFNTEEEEQWK